MPLKAIYENKSDIPEAHVELFTEREGKWELTGVEGIKTQGDVDRVQDTLRKVRIDLTEANTKLGKFKDLDAEEVFKLKDENEELKAQLEAGGGKIDDEKVQALVTSRVNREIAPIKRERDTLLEEKTTLTGQVGELQTSITTGKIRSAIQDFAGKAGVVPTAIGDVVARSLLLFEVAEDKVVTRDNVGVTPGQLPDVWLADQKEKSPHWWPMSQGGGATGRTGGVNGGNNPSSAKNWNMTEQGRYVKEHGMEKAKQMAQNAGTTVGGAKPAQQFFAIDTAV